MNLAALGVANGYEVVRHAQDDRRCRTGSAPILAANWWMW